MIVPGITISNNAWLTLLVVGAILGLVNATLGSVLKFFSFPFIILSFGILNLVINAAMLQFSAWISNGLFGASLQISSFWWALLGGVVISLASMVLSWLMPDPDAMERKKRRRDQIVQ